MKTFLNQLGYKSKSSVVINMKEGDLVYFTKPHHAIYCDNSPSGSYQHNFDLMKPYVVVSSSSTYVSTASIRDLYGVSHFITSEAINKLITHEEFIKLNREDKLKELGL